MTNEEIKKGLECCNSTGPHFCDDCPYCCVGRCRDELITSALNIITEQEKKIEKLKNENVRLTTKLGQVLLSIDTVKEMNTMCAIDEQVKQAKIDVLNELKKKKSIAAWDIDEMIEELIKNGEDKS